MRTLIALLLMSTPALASNPCDDLVLAICPASDVLGQCVAFVDNEMRGPDGKAMTGVNRLMGCKLVLDDDSTLADYKVRMQAKAQTRWYAMQATVEPRKPGGASWDALGGAPDLAACFTVDGERAGCDPGGPKAAFPDGPLCRDAMNCAFKVHARRGAMVSVKVVDIDGMNNDDVGRCDFVAGDGTATCQGALTLIPEGVNAPAAGGVVDSRILGRWDLDIERTMAHDPAYADLSAEARQEAVDRAMGQMHEEYVEFSKGGRVVYTLGEDLIKGRYVITEMKGRTLAVEVVDEGTSKWKVTITNEGLIVKQGQRVLYLERAQ